MPWTKSCSNYRWQIRRPFWIWASTYWDTSKSQLPLLLTVSLPIMWLSWNDHFYGRLLKRLKAMVAYLKASPHKKTYSDYLWAAREVEKEESMELSWNPWSQAIDTSTKPKTTSFFPLQKFKGNQPVTKKAAMCLVHLEEESAKRKEEEEIEDPDGINRVTKEFMVHLAQVVKTPKWRRSTVIIATVPSTLSMTAC